MTRIAYFDMPAGISGDMTLAALLHSGLSLDDLTYALGPLGLNGYALRAESTSQHTLGGTRVVVDVERECSTSWARRGAGRRCEAARSAFHLARRGGTAGSELSARMARDDARTHAGH